MDAIEVDQICDFLERLRITMIVSPLQALDGR
jgi:hypothetical protein